MKKKDTKSIFSKRPELFIEKHQKTAAMKKIGLQVLAAVFLFVSNSTYAQHEPAPKSLTIPNKLSTPIGTLNFNDGAPDDKTTQLLYDNLDFLHAQNVFLNTYQGASTYALGEGLKSIGVNDNEVAIFSNLMDSKSLFLTANADGIYFISILNLAEGPLVVEIPENTLCTFDDMWFDWIIDAGRPGPDRGTGGKYLIVPPEYDGPLPEGGYYVGHSKTNRALFLGRAFMLDNDPKPVVDMISKTFKIYPYTKGGTGTSIAEALAGEVMIAKNAPIPPTKITDVSGKSFNTIPPSDYTFYEVLNKLVQEEPAGSLDPELMGQIAAIGIVKGKPFAPDARMKKILTDAANVGNATARMLNMNPRKSEGFSFYEGSNWTNMLFVGGYNFETPPPMLTKEGFKPFPATGARTLNSRTVFFNGYTGITPAMCMRLPGIGSQYLLATKDANDDYFDGSKTYKIVLPPNIPQANFWSIILYDNQTRSMLQTDQPGPKVGSLNYPRPAAKADVDGSTTIYISPKLPKGVNESNWIQSVPGKGFFTCLRLYSPLMPFFEKTWRPSEVELVK
ncbi:DUF1254 domain-containing protein [Xanthomarina sp. GH4-25]|uniref:DUF1254 domain-containing protein n=1 Tax=Xanthomarina sp. GH4-25 TaxID=3349335 RepID=UPI0038782C41